VGLLHKTFGGLAPDTKILVCCAPAVVIGTGVALTVRALTIGRPVLRTLGMVAVRARTVSATPVPITTAGAQHTRIFVSGARPPNVLWRSPTRGLASPRATGPP
jgi:hypothetical protein